MKARSNRCSKCLRIKGCRCSSTPDDNPDHPCPPQCPPGPEGPRGPRGFQGPPGTPAASAIPLGARVSGAAQAIPSGPLTAIVFNQERFDFGNFFDPLVSTMCLTVPAGAGGVYQISGSVVWADNATGIRGLSVRVDGLTIASVNQLPNPLTFLTAQSISTTYQLEPGDCVELVVLQTSGASLGIIDNEANSPEFALVRVTPNPM